ncbi:hypothetical protein GCM10007103_21180 [Salinimicrobium marinum]|uniref:Uncharacterized protein n=2 Tax=Salinimicrobium marinum TaxID=680283 RepID=A0A918VZ64_9FLAO|nr:hypothetical protein GCM10007103_21180 [Salinimicrobium marinum]
MVFSSSFITAQNTSEPTNFVFKKSMVASQNGISNLERKHDSLIDAMVNPNGKDSLMNKQLKELQMTDFLTQSPDTEIYVEVQNDSVWRYKKLKGEMIGDYLMILKNTGILNYYDRSKSINYDKYDLFAGNNVYEISEDRNDRKEIKGYDYFKLRLVKIDEESDLRNLIYEMYVTDQIDLPIHSVINLGKFLPKTFPMEIKISEEELPGMAEVYEIIEIE